MAERIEEKNIHAMPSRWDLIEEADAVKSGELGRSKAKRGEEKKREAMVGKEGVGWGAVRCAVARQ